MADISDKIRKIEQSLEEIKHSSTELDGIFDNIGKKAIAVANEQSKISRTHLEILDDELKKREEITYKLDAKFRLIKEINIVEDAQTALLRERIALVEAEFIASEKMKKSIDIRNQLLKQSARASGEAYEQASELYSVYRSLINPITAFSQILKITSERFFELDKAAETFREETGLLKSQTAAIDANVKTLSRNFAVYGLDVEKAYLSAKALTDVFGDQFAASNEENVKFVGLMKTNLGVAEEDSARVLQNFMGIGKMSFQSARNMALSAVSLSRAAGVPLGLVMKDVANAAGDTLTMVRGSVTELIRGTIEARRLGTSLEAVSAAGRKMLDFQSSVSDEMEASVLFGKNINLQRARELAYHGDTVGLMNEQNRILKSMGDISKMDVFQQEALAKSLGISTDEMFKRTAKQAELNELQAESPDFFKQYDAQSKALNSSTQSLEEKYKTELLSNQVQSEQTELANSFKQVLVNISDILVPIVGLISLITEGISTTVTFLTGWTSSLSEFNENLGNTAKVVELVFISGLALAGTRWTGFLFKNIYGAFVKRITAMKMFSLKWMPKIFSLEDTVKPKVGGKKIKTPSKKSSDSGFLDNIASSINKVKPVNILAVGASLIMFAGSMWILAKAGQEFNKVEWSSLAKMGVVIGALAITLGILMYTGILETAAVGIALLGASLLPFSVASVIAGAGITLLAKGFEIAVNTFKSFGDINFKDISSGIYTLSAAMTTFGAAMASGGILSFLGGGMMLELIGLAAISPLLEKSGNALDIVSDSLSAFKDNGVITGINAVTQAIKNLNSEIEKTSTLKVMALTAMTANSAQTENASKNENSTAQKLDELIGLMKSGAIAVNIDGNRASYLLSKNVRNRGGLGAIS